MREGLVARVALAEAAGWLAHNGVWVSETDLALRDAGLVGAWGVADHAGRLAQEMPTTAAAADGIAGHGTALSDGALPPDDRLVGFALRLARHWCELAASEAALAGGGAGDPERDGLRRALAALGRGGPMDDEGWRGWLALIEDDAGLPPLVHAAWSARRWHEERAAGEGRGDLLSPTALFLVAALWRGRRRGGLPLPLWSAPPAMLHALALRGAGADAAGWVAGLLAAAAEAARAAHARLLRLPVLTPGVLATHTSISTRAGLALVDRLVQGGVLREATGRGAWRAYALADAG